MPKQSSKDIDPKIQKYRENSNRTRRERYNTDPTYREEKRTASLRHRQQQHGKSGYVNCAENLTGLFTMGGLRSIAGIEFQGPQSTFTYEELAKAIGNYTPACIRRWIRLGHFPDAKHLEYSPTRTGPPKHLYTEQEVRDIIAVFSVHQKSKRNLCADDSHTIAALMALAKPPQA